MNRRDLLKAAVAAPLAAALPAVPEAPVYAVKIPGKICLFRRLPDGSWFQTWEGYEHELPSWIKRKMT
jgi:ABC-type sugar transport system substrate-binding protein